MTFISRGTRIIVSRWLDECDAEYKLRACRKRSDGRLKRHSSCEDLRAWVNNNCVNHEYLVDLMSDGEATGKNRVRTYGRYIPIPVLLKIFQNLKETKKNEIDGNRTGKSERASPETGKVLRQAGKEAKARRETTETGTGCDSQEGSNGGDEQERLWIVECEKYLLEKRFFECKSLLNTAVGKLERIDCIVCSANDEMENSRNEEIEAAFQRSKSVCTCSTINLTSTANLRKEKDVAKCKEVLRKISKLRQKLKIIQEHRREVNEQIRLQASPKCQSRVQVTELFNRRDEAKLKQLQKKLEKLIAGKGKLLSELIEAVSYLNKLKKSILRSRSHLSFNSKSSCGHEEDFRCGMPVTCVCGCQCTDHFDSSNSPPSGDLSQDECFNSRRPSSKVEANRNAPKKLDGCAEEDGRDKAHDEIGWQSVGKAAKTDNGNRNRENVSTTPISVTLKSSMGQRTLTHGKNESKRESSKSVKNSNIKFVCPENACKEKSWTDIFEANNSDYSEGVRRNENVVNSNGNAPGLSTGGDSRSEIPERRVKSETAMEEIEKALRNYDQRLRNLDCIEYEVEKMKEKLVDGSRERREWQKQKDEGEELLAAEREKSKREINQLCSENRALKKQVQQLMANSDIQLKKIQYLKMFEEKFECEAEKLKKKLSHYQNNCENQQKQITMLENYIVNQETEIRKLTKLINKPKTRPNKCFQETNVQRSRSYSPESIKNIKTTCQPVNQGCKCSTSSDEDVGWGCEEMYQQKMRNQQRISGKGCCASQPSRRRV